MSLIEKSYMLDIIIFLAHTKEKNIFPIVIQNSK